MLQHTLTEDIKIVGKGLHSGMDVELVISPAEENKGITFVRSDIKDKKDIAARYSEVVNTGNCTCIGTDDKNSIATIEHLMAALYTVGIDNALIKVSSPEVPILDGSAEMWYKMIKNAPQKEQTSPRRYLKVLREVEYKDESGAYIKLAPYQDGLYINFAIEFKSKLIGHQEFHGLISEDVFAKDIAPCRTFCEKSQIDYLKSIGLIKGGSLDNALVIDGDKVLNPDGLKHQNECVNHKVLDAIGDMYTSGFFILGELSAYKSGHFHNNELLKKLFADSSNYELV
ncbi:MAG: UDP-3-O-[Alphaproteobacteria bacterium]|nr:UDP-3-O-[3-hydroxymyristoyl] N-acetylglucosamine deacetylase [Alphaproteobacteria bacterium]